MASHNTRVSSTERRMSQPISRNLTSFTLWLPGTCTRKWPGHQSFLALDVIRAIAVCGSIAILARRAVEAACSRLRRL